MSVLDEPVKQFTIPTDAELEAIGDTRLIAAGKVDEIHSRLSHATGAAETPIYEFATRPTVEDIGALYLFAQYTDRIAGNLKEWSANVLDLISRVDGTRREWEDGDDAR
jgi:hypothetical protein